jgi:hypothetical protein
MKRVHEECAKRSKGGCRHIPPRVPGLPDVPECYSHVGFHFKPVASATRLRVEHPVLPSPIRRRKNYEIGPKSGEKHVAFYWRGTLPLIRDMVEGRESTALKAALAVSR